MAASKLTDARVLAAIDAGRGVVAGWGVLTKHVSLDKFDLTVEDCRRCFFLGALHMKRALQALDGYDDDAEVIRGIGNLDEEIEAFKYDLRRNL